MTEHFGNALPEMVIEPGRFVVGDAGAGVAPRWCWSAGAIRDDPVRWVYLDIGRFGGLAETEGEAIKYRITTPHDGSAMGPVAIAGPTCDGADILYEKSNYRLPLALTLAATGWSCCPPGRMSRPMRASGSTASRRWRSITCNSRVGSSPGSRWWR